MHLLLHLKKRKRRKKENSHINRRKIINYNNFHCFVVLPTCQPVAGQLKMLNAKVLIACCGAGNMVDLWAAVNHLT